MPARDVLRVYLCFMVVWVFCFFFFFAKRKFRFHGNETCFYKSIWVQSQKARTPLAGTVLGNTIWVRNFLPKPGSVWKRPCQRQFINGGKPWLFKNRMGQTWYNIKISRKHPEESRVLGWFGKLWSCSCHMHAISNKATLLNRVNPASLYWLEKISRLFC